MVKMPGFDGTGPRGQGSMTGRGLGPCNKDGQVSEEYQPRSGRLGIGFGRGQGMGTPWGRGMGRGRGAGRGVGRRGPGRW